MRLPRTEALLAGRVLDDALMREAGRAAAVEAPVVGDQHGSAAYKRVLVEVHLGESVARHRTGSHRMNDSARMSSGQIGRSVPRVEARAKVTGAAEYIHNLRLPGMLYAKICRSTVPHGRIRRIDTRAAAAMPGVRRIVTAEDILTVIPEPYYGPAFHDQPILAEGKVRHVGEPVAAVLAADPHIAEQAAQLIAVDYEPLPAVFDEVEAVTFDSDRARRS